MLAEVLPTPETSGLAIFVKDYVEPPDEAGLE
jgi:hypothetical protein